MTDRELLEFAAKAAGLRLQWRDMFGGYERVFRAPLLDGKFWNPLTDDGDALRLVKVRNMTLIGNLSRGGWSVGAIMDDEFRWLAFDEDCNRAIVRAAAEIGKGMK